MSGITSAERVVEEWAEQHGLSGSAIEDLKARVRRLPRRITIHPPAMPESELVDHLYERLNDANREIARLRHGGDE